MLALAILLLAMDLAAAPVDVSESPTRIDVDCTIDGALERALKRAEKTDGAQIFLYGVCEGGVVVTTDGVSIRGATPDAAIVAPDPPTEVEVLVHVVNAKVNLQDLRMTGSEIGVLVDGWGAEVNLFGIELADQSGGVFARSGAVARVFDSIVRDGDVGVLAQFDATLVITETTVTGHDVGVVVFNESRAALTDSTVENNRTGGLQLEGRCDAVVFGGTFRENGQVHFFAGGRSDVTLLQDVVVGSATDTTGVAAGVNESSSFTSYNTAVLHGDVTALDRGSLRIGNTTIAGSLIASIFSDALVSNTEVVGGIFCQDGSDVICKGGTTTPMVFECPSPSCTD